MFGFKHRNVARALVLSAPLSVSFSVFADEAAAPVPATAASSPPFARTVVASAAAPVQTVVIDAVRQKLDAARNGLSPDTGSNVFKFGEADIAALPLGEATPLNQVVLQAPGVVQDSYGQLHVRGDHANVQYRLDGVQLPEGLSLFNNILATRYADQMSLLTGALPAQYGLHTAGIVDITVKSGTTNPGAEVSVTGGSRDYSQPAFSYGGRSGKIDYFATGQYLHNAIGIENPTSSSWPIHDSTDQWHGLGKVTGNIDEQTRISFIAGGSKSAPNRIGRSIIPFLKA